MFVNKEHPLQAYLYLFVALSDCFLVIAQCKQVLGLPRGCGSQPSCLGFLAFCFLEFLGCFPW